MIRIVTLLAAAFLLPTTAMAEEQHIPGPEESSSAGEMFAATGGTLSLREVRQRKARTTYKAVRGATVEDSRYLGRDIPLDIASVSVSDRDGLSLDIGFWEAPGPMEPESMVVYFAERGAVAPKWAAYQPAPRDGESTDWALFRYDPASGLFDARVSDAELVAQDGGFAFRAQRGEAMPRAVVAFVETRSSDDEDWAWKDQAPTRRTGLKLR